MTRRVGVERIEQVVEEAFIAGLEKHETFDKSNWNLMDLKEVERLLRRELAKRDARVRKVIRQLQREIEDGRDPEHPINCAHHLAYTNLLAALSGRKGK